jgi:hypothetical protein
MVSCGTQKKSVSTVQKNDDGLGVETGMVPALICKLEGKKGTLRGYGSYNDSDMGYAYRGANANARADVAEQMSAMLKSSIDLFKQKHAKSVEDVEMSDMAKDASGTDKFIVTQIADEIVVGAKAIEVNNYRQKNGTYTTHVCVEVDLDMIVELISDNKKVESLITEDEKMKIEFDRAQFKEEMKTLFEEYSQNRAR